MNLLKEEMLKYAGIIVEDISVDRITNAFKAFYNGKNNALYTATLGNICFKDKGNNIQYDEKGVPKLSISDLPEKLEKANIPLKGLLGLKEYVRQELVKANILTKENANTYDQAFNDFARHLSGNMDSAKKSFGSPKNQAKKFA